MSRSWPQVLIDHLNDPILICDEDGVVALANRAAREALGRTLEWLQQQPADTWLQDDRGFLWPADGSVDERVLTYTLPGGDRREVRAVVGPTPIEGGEMGWMIAFRPPSVAANKLVGLQAVTGGIAKELATHAATIINHASSALMNEPPDPFAEPLRNVLSAAEEVAVLQGQLAAVGGGGQMSRVDLAVLLRESAGMLTAILGGHRLHLTVGGLKHWIEGDAATLRMGLVAIAEWIARTHPGGGSVEMRLDPVGSHLRLSVSDDGPGLSLEQRERLFEPFSSPSTGLGLAVVSGIVERHRGRILVDSTPGEGTLFVLELPVFEAQPSVTQLPKGTETILVVEDDYDIRTLVVQILQRQGFDVVTATNGVEGSVVLRQRAPELDLMLCDAVLPGRSGLELVTEARQIRPSLPVVLMTSYSEDFLGPRLEAYTPFLPKPFSPQTLVRKLRSLLDA